MADQVPMTVRFSPSLHEALKRAAEREGVPVAQFVRESVVARITYYETLHVARGEKKNGAE